MMKCPKCNKSDEVVTRSDGTKYCLDCGERVALGPSDATACSLLEWTPNPENPREILGRSKRSPGITLYIIKLMDGRDDRGQMHGAFMSDELEREGLYDKALVNWLKWEAESQMREFLKSHTANA
jgi:hypothetical protein